MTEDKVGVFGAGAFGTALALTQVSAGRNTVLTGRNVAPLIASRENEKYLTGVPLPNTLQISEDLSELANCKVVLLAIPAQKTASALEALKAHLSSNATLIVCAKGINAETGELLHSQVEHLLPSQPYAILSGPSFADDIARGKPTALTIAAHELKLAEELSNALSTPALRLYANDDVIGVELGGALKNVLAIAVGVARGLNLGASAEAALVTRGFAELKRIALVLNAQTETLNGLSGLGDLMLTCSSTQSRNFSYGMAIGQGKSLEGLKLAEGAHTAGIAKKICAERSVDAPIIETVSAVLTKEIEPLDAVRQLLTRPLKAE